MDLCLSCQDVGSGSDDSEPGGNDASSLLPASEREEILAAEQEVVAEGDAEAVAEGACCP